MGKPESVIDIDVLRILFHAGMTIKELAAVFNCSSYPIVRRLREMGLRRTAGPRQGIGSGDKNPAWRGGRRVKPNGYVLIWTSDGTKYEHRLVMEKHLGRVLATTEIVHHIDGDRSNNKIENLKLTTQSIHASIHAPETIKAVRKRNGYRSSTNPCAKLTYSQAQIIKRSKLSCPKLAKLYGLHHSTIWAIKVGRIWNYE